MREVDGVDINSGTRKYICVAYDPYTDSGEGSEMIGADNKQEAMEKFQKIYPGMEIRGLSEIGK